MSSITENILNTLAEAEAAAMVAKSKAEDVITICRKARKKLTAKGVSASIKSQSPVVQMVVASAVTKRAKKHIK